MQNLQLFTGQRQSQDLLCLCFTASCVQMSRLQKVGKLCLELLWLINMLKVVLKIYNYVFKSDYKNKVLFVYF